MLVLRVLVLSPEGRYFWSHPTFVGHERLQDYCRNQQGQGGPDFSSKLSFERKIDKYVMLQNTTHLPSPSLLPFCQGLCAKAA